MGEPVRGRCVSGRMAPEWVGAASAMVSAAGGGSISDQFDAGVGEGDLSFLVEFSRSHFECFLTHAEEGVDRFGIRPVVIGQATFVFFQQAEDFVGGIFDPAVAGAAGGDVDLGLAGRGLVGGENVFDETGKAVTDFDIPIDFVEMEDAGMAVIDDDDIADIGAAVDDEIDEVIVLYGQVLIAEGGFDLFGGSEATGLFIQVDADEVIAAEAHAAELFGFRDEDIFHQPPVEEGALRGDADHLQQDDIAEDPFGLLGGGDDPVFAVMIEEDLEMVAGFGMTGHESFGQEDAFAAIVEDETHGEFPLYGHGVVFADPDHRVKVRSLREGKSCRFA